MKPRLDITWGDLLTLIIAAAGFFLCYWLVARDVTVP